MRVCLYEFISIYREVYIQFTPKFAEYYSVRNFVLTSILIAFKEKYATLNAIVNLLEDNHK